MDLPVMPPVKPMLAKAVTELPPGEPGELLFEPKWDGFRCVVFRDGDEVVLGSRNERPLTRYFPELLDPLRASLPDRCVVDGEVLVATGDRLDFDALQQRIHPAESRVNRLAVETPAEFVAFDVLAVGADRLVERPFSERRETLEGLAATFRPPILLTPMTTDRELAADWFVRFEGAGLDGVMAKPAQGPYMENKRVQFKVKHKRTADAVVAGFRVHKSGDGVGSLLLGLYDERASLHHVGVAASFTGKRRVELVDELAPYHLDSIDEHPWAEWARQAEQLPDGRMPGGPSRWNATKDLSWEPLRIALVAEVSYESVLNGRFRATTRMVRWRPDRTPDSCTYEQLETIEPVSVSEILRYSDSS